MGILDLRHFEHSVYIKSGCRQYKNGRINKECQVKGYCRIDKIIFQGLLDALIGLIELACLNQGRMQIEIMGHYGCPDNTNGDIKCRTIGKGRPKACNHRTEERRVGNEWVSTCSSRCSPANSKK